MAANDPKTFFDKITQHKLNNIYFFFKYQDTSVRHIGLPTVTAGYPNSFYGLTCEFCLKTLDWREKKDEI